MIITLKLVDNAVAVQAGISDWWDALPTIQINSACASVFSPQASGNQIIVDLQKNGTSILGTPLTINSGELVSQIELLNVACNPIDRLSMVVLSIGDGTAMGLKGTFGYTETAPAQATPAPVPSAPVSTLINPGTGTHFGNMTVLGGIAAAFDGIPSKAASACAAISNAIGYVGTTWSSGKIFSKAIVSGANNGGFIDEPNGSIVINIYGANTQPSTPTGGTLIGTLSFANVTDESAGQTITSIDQTNRYTSIWAEINGGAGNSNYCAQLVLYELLPS